MAAGLANILTNYKAKLVTAGFTALPQGMRIDAVATLDAAKKIFFLSLEKGIPQEESYGAGVAHLSAVVLCQVRWNPGADQGALALVMATDVETLTIAMLKASNRSSEVMKVSALGGSAKSLKNEASWAGRFNVDYRIAADET